MMIEFSKDMGGVGVGGADGGGGQRKPAKGVDLGETVWLKGLVRRK